MLLRVGVLDAASIGDREEMAETTELILALADRLTGTVILPAHDRCSAARLAAAGGRAL
jgi:glyoxylase-like metal-dependent hydrolase (beta-lactamase superfamily II)